MRHRSFRLLALLIAVVLPLRLAAASIVPIVGIPGHAHEQRVDRTAPGHAHEHVPVSAAAPDESTHGDAALADGHRACAAHAAVAQAADDTLHEHGCPHLGMASIAAPALPQTTAPTPPRIVDAPAVCYVSIVLDVPSPPPTVRA